MFTQDREQALQAIQELYQKLNDATALQKAILESLIESRIKLFFDQAMEDVNMCYGDNPQIQRPLWNGNVEVEELIMAKQNAIQQIQRHGIPPSDLAIEDVNTAYLQGTAVVEQVSATEASSSSQPSLCQIIAEANTPDARQYPFPADKGTIYDLLRPCPGLCPYHAYRKIP